MLGLKKLNREAVNRLKKRWEEQLNQITSNNSEFVYLESGYERLFDWFEKHAGSDRDDYLYCHDDGNTIKAVAEITTAAKSKDPSCKLLNIYVEPDLNPEWMEILDGKILHEITSTVLSVIVGAVDLSGHNNTKKLKIYGRTEEMMSLFDALLTEALSTEDLKIYKQGKWLIIES